MIEKKQKTEQNTKIPSQVVGDRSFWIYFSFDFLCRFTKSSRRRGGWFITVHLAIQLISVRAVIYFRNNELILRTLWTWKKNGHCQQQQQQQQQQFNTISWNGVDRLWRFQRYLFDVCHLSVWELVYFVVILLWSCRGGQAQGAIPSSTPDPHFVFMIWVYK